jgi:exopolysaccharide production protein ExoQ
MIDKFAILPILACVYVTIVSPLLAFDPAALKLNLAGVTVKGALDALMAPHVENKIFWPGLFAMSVMLAILNWSRLAKFTWPPHLIFLFAYLALGGASILWAFRPEYSSFRFVNQVMIVASIVVPAILAARTADLMRCLFLCFAFASILNIPFVLNQTPIVIGERTLGYPGFYSFKGILGECASIAFLLALHEMLYPGLRRASAIIVIIVATWLTFVSQSKGSLGFAIISPLLAGLTLITARRMRISIAVLLLSILTCYLIFSTVTGFTMNKLSWYIYGNYNFSGRTVLWDFANYEIGQRSLLGWGFASFWLVGLDAPSVVDAPGWVKTMMSAHNGYLDVKLELGHVGFALFLGFIITTLHVIGRVADRDRTRAWIMLSLALYVILTNFLETTWVHGSDTLWVIFLIVVAEAARYWHPFPSGGHSHYVAGRAVARNRGAGAESKIRV